MHFTVKAKGKKKYRYQNFIDFDCKLHCAVHVKQ